MELPHRSFRTLNGPISAAATPFFTDATSFAFWLRADRSLLRVPERRFTLDSSAEARIGRTFAQDLGAFASARASLDARCPPHAAGDDYEMRTPLRPGGTLAPPTPDAPLHPGTERANAPSHPGPPP